MEETRNEINRIYIQLDELLSEENKKEEANPIDYLYFVKPSQPKKEKVNRAVAWGVR